MTAAAGSCGRTATFCCFAASFDQAHGPLDRFAQVVPDAVQDRWAGEVKQPLDRVLHTSNFLLNDPQLLVVQTGSRPPPRGRLDQQLDGRERIPQFVRNAGGQLAHRRELLGPNQLLPRLLELVEHAANPLADGFHLLLQGG